jgi:2-phospho-L-lactate guanylyltransferase
LTGVLIVIVVRDPRRAKTRLRTALAPRQRASLAQAMLDDVIGAATRTRRPVLVVTDARSVAVHARRLGARATVTPAQGTRDGAAHGVRLAARYGAGAALVVAADLPFATAADLRRVIAAGRHAEIVIVPDGVGSGTNALFLRPPSRLAPLFGHDSLAAHRRAAGSHGQVLRIARLGIDIDSPDDLRALQRSARWAGTNTRRVLAAIASGAAPSTRRESPSPRAARSRTRRSPLR